MLQFESFIIQVLTYSREENYSSAVGKLFKGEKYSREETINHLEVLTAETIQRRKVFKGGKTI